MESSVESEVAAMLIETSADTPPTAGALIENLRKLIDEAKVSAEDEDSEGAAFQNFKATDFENICLGYSADDLMRAAPGELNILQAAAIRGLEYHVRCLLLLGVNPNIAESGTYPALLFAALNGHYKVLREFVDHKIKKGNYCNCKSTVPTTRFDVIEPNSNISLLHAILNRGLERKWYGAEHGLRGKFRALFKAKFRANRYEECWSTVMSCAFQPVIGEIRRVVNLQEKVCFNTALHYAIEFWPQDVVRTILEMGANIGLENTFGATPISRIVPNTMASFLDEFCLISDGDVMTNEFSITARFDIFAPPKSEANGFIAPKGHYSKENEDNCIKRSDRDFANSKKIRHTHENIEEQRQINNDDEGQELLLPETDGVWYMSQSNRHRNLLKHPVVRLFMAMKWKRMSRMYNISLLYFLISTVFTNGYIFALYSGNTISAKNVFSGKTCSNSSYSSEIKSPTLTPIDVLWYCLVIMLVLIIFREVIQIGVSIEKYYYYNSRYFLDFRNLIEITFILLESYVLFYGDYCYQVDAKRHASAMIIVLQWFSVITAIGRSPSLLTYNIYLTMFYTVSITFVTFLLWYSLFIIAFGLAFYILLHKDTHKNTDAESYFFDKVDSSLVKVFTMFVGELEFADLPFETPVGYLFLLAFVFLIVVVMMNLLNGLAVSDIGVIREQSEIYSYRLEVETITHLEDSMLWLSNLATKCHPVSWIYRAFYIHKAINHFFIFSKGQVLATKHYITLLPNNKNSKCSKPLLCCCGNFNKMNDTDEQGRLYASNFPGGVLHSAKEYVITLQNLKREQREENGRKDEEHKIEVRLANIEKISNGMDARLANIEETIKRFVEQAQKTRKSE